MTCKYEDCSGLTSINIPEGVTTIQDGAFRGCSGLTSVTIPSSVKEIYVAAFKDCTGELIINGNISASFSGSLFTSIKMNGEIIGDYAFSNLSSIHSVELGNSVKTIGNKAFYGCSGLTFINIPSSVTNIGEGAFGDCSSLRAVSINCAKVGTWFSGLTSIKEIVLGENVTSIVDSAFRNCSGLTTVSINSAKVGTWFSGLTSIKEILLGENVTTIGNSAFENCSGLTSINIPSSVTDIGSRAFCNCDGLTSITIPVSVTSIGSKAFYDCAKLKKTIWLTNTPPNGYRNVDSVVNFVANEQYSGLKNIIVYPFLSSIFEVDGIKYVPVSPSERTCDAIDFVHNNTTASTNIPSTVTYKGISMTVKNVQPYLCYGNTYIEKLTCDNNGTIATSAFYGCVSMKSLTLGMKVSSIGDNAFQGCSSLKSVVIPNTITELSIISNNAFQGCSSLKSFTIPNSVKELGSHSFSGCASLPKINIPNSVIAIKDNVFFGCTAMKEIIIEDRDEELTLGSNGSSPLFSDCPLDSVYIGGNITYNTSSNNGFSPFYRNQTLRTVVITDKETEISENEFYACTNLQNFKIGDGVTTFGNRAFSGCSKLTYLSFGTQLKTIGKEAFSDCTSVTWIDSRAVTPPVCDTQALDDINKWICKLYVPENSISFYQTADQWKEFFFIEGITGMEPIRAADVEPQEIYDIQGRRVIRPEKGIYIIEGRKVLVK